VFVNKDAIIQGVMDNVLGGLGGGLTPELPTGVNDLAPTPQASADLPSF